MFSLLSPLCIETGTIWRKLVTSLVWLIVAALTLTAWLPPSIWFSQCSNRLCFLMRPLIPHAWLYNLWLHILCLDIRNISIASSLLRTDQTHSCSWIVDNSKFLSAISYWALINLHLLRFFHVRTSTEFQFFREPFVSICASLVFFSSLSLESW